MKRRNEAGSEPESPTHARKVAKGLHRRAASTAGAGNRQAAVLDSSSALNAGDYEALSLRGGFLQCMNCIARSDRAGVPADRSEGQRQVAAVDHLSTAVLANLFKFIFFDVECAFVPGAGPWDGTASCNAIAQIAAATVAAAPGGAQRQQRLFNVYVRTPSNVVGMRAAPEEASIAEADKLSPAAALQKFVDWALKQQRQHAGQQADPSRLVLVSHYGFCYASSILVQHAECCGVQLPPVRLADACLWTKATYGGNKEAPLEDLADLLLYDRQWDHFNDVVRTQQHYALADVLATSQCVGRLGLSPDAVVREKSALMRLEPAGRLRMQQ
ncbi:hypothetical protein OEZ85_002146 [Tetradesmus obliquus]|uniref:Exonuclease domain-containing protein n=1 Tax=Tetradesmus obliquus TaxID=3088 RepID=A0ABY8U292_TETOB|nr:hypothetical protein OEZ85_002146 [Tetradesmus obliquus]